MVLLELRIALTEFRLEGERALWKRKYNIARITKTIMRSNTYPLFFLDWRSYVLLGRRRMAACGWVRHV